MIDFTTKKRRFVPILIEQISVNHHYTYTGSVKRTRQGATAPRSLTLLNRLIVSTGGLRVMRANFNHRMQTIMTNKCVVQIKGENALTMAILPQNRSMTFATVEEATKVYNWLNNSGVSCRMITEQRLAEQIENYNDRVAAAS